jgi:hypothetical protein
MQRKGRRSRPFFIKAGRNQVSACHGRRLPRVATRPSAKPPTTIAQDAGWGTANAAMVGPCSETVDHAERA